MSYFLKVDLNLNDLSYSSLPIRTLILTSCCTIWNGLSLLLWFLIAFIVSNVSPWLQQLHLCQGVHQHQHYPIGIEMQKENWDGNTIFEVHSQKSMSLTWLSWDYIPEHVIYKPLFRVLQQVRSGQEVRQGQGAHGHHQHQKIPVSLAHPLVQQDQSSQLSNYLICD